MVLDLMRVDVFGSEFGESIILRDVHIDNKNKGILILGKDPRV